MQLYDTCMTHKASLADANWSPCSAHAVVLAFLRAEWDKPLPGAFPLRMIGDRGIIDKADLEDATENNIRSSLLWSIRAGLLQGVPTDTRWFDVRHLREQHFHQVRAINYRDWTSPADCNELENVAARKRLELEKPVTDWQPPIMWGHDRKGPITILEGNHRLAALASSAQRDSCALPVYVGLSANLCRWHLPDKRALIEQGWPPEVL